MAKFYRFDAAALRKFGADVFAKAGLPLRDSALVSQCLVQADLWGQSGHGLQRIPMYMDRLRAGVVKPVPNIKVERKAAAASMVDGDDGMGFVVATQAVDEAIALAKESGVGLAGVRNSTHFGCSAHYVRRALDQDMVSFVFTNSSPAFPPFGGTKPLLGASPFAAGVPSSAQPPLVLDFSMTVIARGKLRLAAQRGEPIPEGIALDAQGRPTRDGMEAFHGVSLPFGGAKGACMALLMDALSGVLTGAAYAGGVRSLYNDTDGSQNVGHFILCARPDLFLPMDEFKSRMDDFVQICKAQPLAEGFSSILMPGEPESLAEAERLRVGVPLQADVVESLQAEAARHSGIRFPDAISQE